MDELEFSCEEPGDPKGTMELNQWPVADEGQLT
jgi:hypothetical protein